MGIRNHKGTIRIVSIILIVGFALSMLITGIISLKNNVLDAKKHGDKTQAIVTVNKEKITRDEFNLEVESLKENLRASLQQKQQQLAQMGADSSNLKEIPEEILKEYTLQLLINKDLLLSSAKDLNVKISGSEVDKKMQEYYAQAGGKNNFLMAIRSRGYSFDKFKETIKEQELIQKIQDKIASISKVDESELKKAYERYKYASFGGRPYEEVKPRLEQALNNEKGTMMLSSYIFKAREKAKIDIKDPEIKKLYDQINSVVAEKDGYKYTKASLNEQLLSDYTSTPDGYSEEKVQKLRESFKQNLDKFIAIAAKAKAAGIKADKEFVGIDELSDYSKKYYDYLVDSYKPSEQALLDRFNSRRDKYNQKNTISGYVVGQDYKASSKDFESAKKQAEEIMKTTNKENFAAKAEQFSKDPGSAKNGGSLGESTDLSKLVPEFAQAVNNAKVGEIVGPVKSEYGYHIIYVQGKNAQNPNVAKVSHILITPTISEETKKAVAKQVQDLKAELLANKVTWDKIEKQDKYKYDTKEQFSDLTKDQPIPGIGKANPELSNKLFAAKTNEILDYGSNEGYFLLTKTSEIPFKEAKFEDVKERIRVELGIEYANKEMGLKDDKTQAGA